jgi:peptidoglycan/LPS O-acetylase OafA/YrhL
MDEQGRAAPADQERMRVVPGLDGLRGVAVLSVMAFHAGLQWARGGLLGVDIFFVLSGFLVTSLLLDEHRRTATIGLRRFWAGRARRLLPALFLLLAGVCAWARWAGDGIPLQQVRSDAYSTLAYVANWHYVASGQNYFVRFAAPSPLLHTWSLAVEEQFYLVWPLVVLFVLRRFGARALGWVAAVLAAGSAAWCASLLLIGTSIDRLYYGTDTRAQAIMIGALLAVVVPIGDRQLGPTGSAAPRLASGAGPRPRSPGRDLAPARSDRLLGPVGLVGASVLAFSLHSIQGSGPFLYEGGFLIVGLCTASVVAVTVRRPGHPLSRLLSWRPLRFTGRISYGLYLYHWPLFLVLTQARTGLSGTALVALRFGVTFAVAAASYRFVECPIRARRPLTVPVGSRPGRGRPRTLRAGLAAVPVVIIVALVAATAPPGTTASAALEASRQPPVGYVAPDGADAPHPEQALLIGDSMALTLGLGLSVNAPAWGIRIDNEGALGCDLDPRTTVDVMGTVSQASQGCPQWPTTWARTVAQTNPDVVVVFLGRWETIDRRYDGRWTHVGEATFDDHLQAELGQVIDIAASHRAQVVFLTLPFIAQTTAQPDGSPWDMNLPSRTDAYNADVRAAVARHPGQATVLDLNKMLDPNGRYVSYIDGVRVRDTDDEHISILGGELLRPQLLPSLVQLGSAHYEARVRPLPSPSP